MVKVTSTATEYKVGELTITRYSYDIKRAKSRLVTKLDYDIKTKYEDLNSFLKIVINKENTKNYIENINYNNNNHAGILFGGMKVSCYISLSIMSDEIRVVLYLARDIIVPIDENACNTIQDIIEQYNKSPFDGGVFITSNENYTIACEEFGHRKMAISVISTQMKFNALITKLFVTKAQFDDYIANIHTILQALGVRHYSKITETYIDVDVPRKSPCCTYFELYFDGRKTRKIPFNKFDKYLTKLIDEKDLRLVVRKTFPIKEMKSA